MNDEQFQSRPPINFLDPKNNFPETPKPKKRWFLYLIIIAILLLAGDLGVRAFSLGANSGDSDSNNLTLTPKNGGFFQAVKNFIFRPDNVLAGQTDDRINILLLGIGGSGHDGAYLSDTNIILSIKPSTKEAAMISVPRDLGVKMNGRTYKINSADAFGENQKTGTGGEYARQIFSKNFDLDIPYYARVDFTAFSEIIDAVGGVTIDVPRSFSDNLYPGPNNSYNPIKFEAGTQTMNGERALQYARSRHGNNGEGSDFARAHRQQQVITALKQKLLSFGTYTNPAVIQQILTSVSAHTLTNLEFSQIMYLASLAKEINDNIKTLVLDDSPDGFLYSYIASDTGAYLLGPKTGNFDKINEAIKYVFDTNHVAATQNTTVTTPAQANKSVFPGAKIEIQNGTWHAGLAAKYKTQLTEKGFTIYSTGNSTKRPMDTTGIYLINQSVSNDIVKALSEDIKAPIITTLPDWLSEGYDDPNTSSTETGLKFKPESDILIILGEDANK